MARERIFDLYLGHGRNLVQVGVEIGGVRGVVCHGVPCATAAALGAGLLQCAAHAVQTGATHYLRVGRVAMEVDSGGSGTGFLVLRLDAEGVTAVVLGPDLALVGGCSLEGLCASAADLRVLAEAFAAPLVAAERTTERP